MNFFQIKEGMLPSQGTHFFFAKSLIFFGAGQKDLNPRPSRWQRDALPLSYARNRNHYN